MNYTAIRMGVCCSLIATGPALAQSFGVNLITNGGAETGDISGWVDGGIEAMPATGFAIGFGDFVFTGATGPATCQTLAQEIDLSPLSDVIDQGCVTARFDIELQSREGDIGSATIDYLDDFGTIVATRTLTDPGSSTYDWGHYFDERQMALGTRRFRVTLCAVRNTGLSSDAFFDEVSLVLTSAGGDFNDDGQFDFFDVQAFLQAFAGDDPAADFTADGLFDFFDVQAFLQAFAAACP